MSLGAVSIDVHRKEREFGQLTLSDEKVVEYLIKYRSKVDMSYGATVNIEISQAGDLSDFNVELIALYASLDNIIHRIKMKDKDRKFLELIFEGNEIMDVITYHNYPIKTAYRTLERIVKKIVKQNNADWKETMRIQGFIT